ncbi:transglycosylase SLT domain-containing protein [Methyloglobulus sp.]|uniref:lytic transglycosylase domain-containing protein n=1 Tax=Methyloglobulus sp. TaxID=2518622 RepID=UPI0039897EBB
MNLNRLKQAVWLCGLLLLPHIAMSSDKLNDQRQAFLQAEKYLAGKNEAAFLAVSSSLPDYPLYPYLRYQRIKDQLAQTDQVLAFLSTYKDTRYAPLLRSKWLGYLAEHERWYDFIRQYEVNESSADDCQFHWAQYQTGKLQQALLEAKRLWVLGTTTAKNCQPLFSALLRSSLLTADLIWQRFESALQNNNLAAARLTSLLLKQADRKNAENWLQLHQKPELIAESQFWKEKNEQTGRLFAHAVERLASSDLERAIAVWDTKKSVFFIDDLTVQRVERKLGMALLAKKDNRAYGRLNKVFLPDEEVRTAKLRAALVEQNWRHVSSALAGLTYTERQEPKWQYWLARALQETGNKQQAGAIYNALAKDRSFYGFMAADTVNTPYQIIDQPVKLAKDALRLLSEETDFKVCQELNFLNRALEARRQWQFAIKKLPKEKLLTAAKLAQQWQWDQIAITTLVKADYWDDMALRFPIHYFSEVQASAYKHNLDTALLYGLIRQESMLDKNAVSSAGAKGLMQLMPKTAMTVAQALHEPWRSDSELFKPELNINYGGYYFRDLLNRFGGHIAVAGAAYNAGPGRAKKWLPITHSVPADIWIETIPFKETRKYVANVLSYAMIYQQRLKKGKLKLKNLLRDVTPG